MTDVILTAFLLTPFADLVNQFVSEALELLYVGVVAVIAFQILVVIELLPRVIHIKQLLLFSVLAVLLSTTRLHTQLSFFS